MITAHDYRVCSLPECEDCQDLVDNGFVMACDDCGSPGSTDSDGWVVVNDGRTLCVHCGNDGSS